MTVNSGIWPTMITPFTRENRIDYALCERLIAQYASQGVTGIFACCQSSEMFFLSREERLALARFVARHAPASIDVAASGHIEDSPAEQIDYLKALRDTGVKALVLVTNRLARADEGEDALLRRAESILAALPDAVFGLYECPYPYKRLLTPETLRALCATGRFAFVKDTCCDIGQIAPKLAALRGTGVKWFNANTDTLLASLRLGGAGLSGIMANFHADLYVRLYQLFEQNDPAADALQVALSALAVPAHRCYPLTAKYYYQLLGWPMTMRCRSRDASAWNEQLAQGVRGIWDDTRRLRAQYIK